MHEETASITQHFSQFRKTLIQSVSTVCVASFLSFYFYKPLFQLLTAPLAATGNTLVLFTPFEGFIIALKASFFSGLLFSSPIWITFLIRFITPGLKPDESKLLLPFLIFSYIFLSIGLYIGFAITIPFANTYFYTFNEGIGQNLWSAAEYLNYTFTLLIAHGAVFELFVGLLFLVHFHILKASTMEKYRRQVILGAFIIGAITTPPDVFTQVIMSTILLAIYELAIFYAKLRQRKKRATLTPMKGFPS